MTKSKNTKRALLLSVLSMMLCVAMLAGSTFAWFTDSVETANNKIVAGNLDVELLAKDGSDYKNVTAETNLFLKDALWEPGHVEVVNLKVANVGTLALTYKLGINKVSETGSVNVYGDAFKLSDYIMFALIDGEEIFAEGDEGRAAAIAAAEENSPAKLSALVSPNEQNGVLYPAGKGDSEKYVTLVVYMPWDTDNKANYRAGEAVPTINLGVKLEATQTPYENDSFNDQYDNNAKNDILTGTTEWFDEDKYADTTDYSVASASDLLALQQAVTNQGFDFAGKTVTLSDNIDISAYENWAPIGSKEHPFAGTFDGGNNTISGLKITEDVNGLAGLFGKVEGATIKNLTVDGNITLSTTDETNDILIGGICASGKNVTVENCTNNVAVDASQITGSETYLAPGVYVGGIVGGVETAATFTNCTNTANLTASVNEDIGDYTVVGGITSAVYMQKVVDTDCLNRGTLVGIETYDLYGKA